MNVGIIGAGQLGRMLALAGYPLGHAFRFLDPAADACAGQVAPLITRPYDDPEGLSDLASWADVVTYEFENVPATATDRLAGRVPLFPPPRALEIAQDRLATKTFFRRLGIPTADFAPVASLTDLRDAVASLGTPCILKTRRLGYDGKGQAVISVPDDLSSAWETLGAGDHILEAFVPFDRELSVIAVRGRDGTIALYDLVENHHRSGILRLSLAPAPSTTPALRAAAEAYARAVLTDLDYVGVLAIELFERDGELLANEMAPRVHNSGHWTIEGAETSQFENHVRAVTGLPLGSTALIGPSAMINIIGDLPPSEPLLAVPGAHLHLYGKAPRPGRKLGHVTVRAGDAAVRDERLGRLRTIVDIP